MANEAFYKKSFQIQCNYPTSKIDKDKLTIFNSSEQMAGGYPWVVSLQYKCTGRKGTVPYLNAYIKVAKGDDTEWSCAASSQVRLISQAPDARDVIWANHKEFKQSANSWGSQKFCEWSKLPSYVKDGKLFLDITLTVDKDSCKGGELPPGAIEELLNERTRENEELKAEVLKNRLLLEEKNREISLLQSQLEKARLRQEKIRKREVEAGFKAEKGDQKNVQEEINAQKNGHDQKENQVDG